MTEAPLVLMVILKPGTSNAQVVGLRYAFKTYPGVQEVLPVGPGEQMEMAAMLDLLHSQPPLVP